MELIFYAAEFTLEWHLTDKGEVVFIFCISTNPKLYLALDRFSYAVRGMVSPYRNICSKHALRLSIARSFDF